MPGAHGPAFCPAVRHCRKGSAPRVACLSLFAGCYHWGGCAQNKINRVGSGKTGPVKPSASKGQVSCGTLLTKCMYKMTAHPSQHRGFIFLIAVLMLSCCSNKTFMGRHGQSQSLRSLWAPHLTTFLFHRSKRNPLFVFSVCPMIINYKPAVCSQSEMEDLTLPAFSDCTELACLG